MSSVANILLEKEILLESGTNELEILVFRVADCTFGINVAKVREVLPAPRITSLPQAHASVLGLFQLRDAVVPCVSLHRHLELQPVPEPQQATLILTDFNNHQTAFVVDAVERIHRLSWEHILAVPSLMALQQTPVTAVARIDDRLVIMLDFEMISDQVTDQFYRTGPVANPFNLPRGDLRLLLADDSPTVRHAIESTLRGSGYTNLKIFENGALAWEWIERRYDEVNDVAEVADLLISDVEMPQVDGLHLTKKIKEHPGLHPLPVMLYSSIVSPDNYKKGQAVGADAQCSKPELAKVVELADQLIQRSLQGRRPPSARPPAQAPATAESPAPTSTPVASPTPTATQPHAETKRPGRQPVTNTATTSAAMAAPVLASLDPALWQTFKGELRDYVARLRDLWEAPCGAAPDTLLINALFRTLHSLKSAASVVPLPAITHQAHQMETVLEPWRVRSTEPLPESLQSFIAWLADLAETDREAATMLRADALPLHA